MKKKILISIGIIVLALIFISAFVFLYKFNDLFNKDELNYKLVFNPKYYAALNPDVKNSVGENEEDLLNHFIEKGMSEGRKASVNFDVAYYKEHNADLEKQFGDDLKQYYIHYMTYGREECRQGSIDDVSRDNYDINLTCELSTDYALKVNMEFGKEYQLQRYYLFEMPAYENNMANAELVSKGLFQERIILSNKRLTNKYVVCIKENGTYKQVSNFAYIQNPEVACTYKVNPSSISTALSKKGLMVDKNTDEIEYIEDLNPTFVNVDFYLDELLVLDPSGYEEGKLIEYEYFNKSYYFNKDKITELDDMIKYYNDLGVNIVSNILLRNNGSSVKELFYNNIEEEVLNNSSSHEYLAIDTSRESSALYFESFMNFISKRYNSDESSKGCISRWVIGSKVNLNETNNYMGSKDINLYTNEYVRTFKIAYNIIKSNNNVSKIYVPIEKWWEISSSDLNYSGREFLSAFNSKIKASGNVDWDLVYNNIEYPENDPDYLNDSDGILLEDGITEDYSKIAIDNFNTFAITIKNISVLTEYLHQDGILNSSGEVRSLIIYNNGITSNSSKYGVSESKQAAEMLYAFYKAELNDTIDAIMFTSLHDNQELLNSDIYSSYGLLYKDGFNINHKKLSYDIYRTMDYKDSIEGNAYLQKVLDINSDSFSNIIENYNVDYLRSVLNNVPKQSKLNINNQTGTEEEQANQNENTNENSANNNVEKIDISSLDFKFKDNINTFKFTGTSIIPEIEVSSNGIYLINDQDYDYLVFNNDNAGTGKIIVIGINSFRGIKILDFNIN